MLHCDDIAAKCAAIPPFPHIATEVLRALKDPNARLDSIIGLVERDVAITTAVLKTANSGLYGRNQPVASVPSALNRLGSEMFSQIVVRVSVKNFVGASMPMAQMKRCWAHCIACAEISKMLALRVGLPPDIAHSAGLLHDLGRFGLALAMPADYARLSRGDGYVDVLDAEYRIFGTDHTSVGRLLAEKFGLPDEIRMVAGRHHDRSESADADLLAVVSAACAIGSAVGFQAVARPLNKTLESVIADAPASLRGHIEPDPDYWNTALVDIVDAS